MQARLSKLPWIEIGILLLAVVLRVVLLDIKPAHFDEGVNGWFADQMTDKGYFQYDPTNYHGPLHFYAVFLSQTLFGRNLWALRLPAIIAGLLCVWAMLRYREFFGSTTARIAALAMAVSPAYVFYGRYSIHESELVFFLATAVWGIIGLWQAGERRHLFALLLGVTGMILTKETYVLHIASFVLAGLVLWIWQKIIPSRPSLSVSRQKWTIADQRWGIGLSVFAIIFFYSGTFLNFSILHGLYQTFAAWFDTGVESAGHAKKDYDIWFLNYYWIVLMARYEWPALAGFLACFYYIGPTDARLRYLAIYGGGVLLAYSLIPYKTPWCIISILWPFLLLFGAIVTEGIALLKKLSLKIDEKLQPILPVAAGLVLLVSLGMTIRLNFFQFANAKEPYVYVQTYPEIKILTDPLLETARKNPATYHLRGQILLDSYYPLPWILGDFTSVGYYKDDAPPTSYDADFIVAPGNKSDVVESSLKGAYYKRSFHLRDSQDPSVVYFREAPFREWFRDEPPTIFQP